MLIGPVEHKTKIRFKNMDDFESYINKIDVDYDSEDVTFTGYVYKISTPQFKRVKRFQYDKGTDFKQAVVDCTGNNCCIPTSSNCLLKRIIYFTKKKDYTEEILTFIRTKKYRSGVMRSARIQPFCRKYNIDIGFFDGTRTNARNITERNIALKIHNNHFCLNWKSNDISFIQAINKL